MACTEAGSPVHALVLQGGGALGSYQAGVCEALAETGFGLDWVAGISIGAVNAAIIAGNPPERRTERLREFWSLASSALPWTPPLPGERLHSFSNDLSAGWIAAFGVPGFFAPRLPPPLFWPPGSTGALSFYDTAPLRRTLERLVDFDRINAGGMRFSVGAVNVRTGNFAYFDNTHQPIGPEHVMASGALPPGLPPIEIEGEHYWDGGLVSNTPLQYVLDEEQARDLTILQVDLFPARGPMPRTVAEAAGREKDIRYSSRTRLNTDANLRIHRAKTALRRLVEVLPPGLIGAADLDLLRENSRENSVTVAQLIYRARPYERSSKDYEFSRASMLEHWAAGRADAARTLLHRDWLDRRRPAGGVATFDLSRPEHEEDGAAAPRGPALVEDRYRS